MVALKLVGMINELGMTINFSHATVKHPPSKNPRYATENYLEAPSYQVKNTKLYYCITGTF